MDAINSLLDPVRPPLLSLLRSLPSPIHNLAISQIGPKCHSSLLLDLDLSARNADCLKLAFSKVLGTAVVVAAAVIKVPQLLNIVRSKSAEGLSFLSNLLETISFLITLAYSVRHGFPFSTYGETAFLTLQDVVVCILILRYGRSEGFAPFLAGLVGASYLLFEPSDHIVDMRVLGYLQAAAGMLGIVSKLPQIWANYSEGSTGQLSALATFGYLAGSLARIFTTLQEVDDALLLYQFIAGFALNAILAAQMVYYWNSKPAKAPAPKAKPQAQAVAEGESSAVSSGVQSSKSPSTRRRG